MASEPEVLAGPVDPSEVVASLIVAASPLAADVAATICRGAPALVERVPPLPPLLAPRAERPSSRAKLPHSKTFGMHKQTDLAEV